MPSWSHSERKYIRQKPTQSDNRAVFVVISVYVTHVTKNSNKHRNVEADVSENEEMAN